MAALKIFVVRSKSTGKVERLVKAATRGQVQKHLSSSIEIEALDAVELMELLDGNSMKVEDATAVAGDDAGTDTGAPTGDAVAPAASADAPAADAPAADAPVAEAGSGEQA